MNHRIRDLLIFFIAGLVVLFLTRSAWGRTRSQTKVSTELTSLASLAEELSWILGTTALTTLLRSVVAIEVLPLLTLQYLLRKWPWKRWELMTKLDRYLLTACVVGLLSIVTYLLLFCWGLQGLWMGHPNRLIIVIAATEFMTTIGCIVVVLGWLLHQSLRELVPRENTEVGYTSSAPLDGPIASVQTEKRVARPTLVHEAVSVAGREPVHNFLPEILLIGAVTTLTSAVVLTFIAFAVPMGLTARLSCLISASFLLFFFFWCFKCKQA